MRAVETQKWSAEWWDVLNLSPLQHKTTWLLQQSIPLSCSSIPSWMSPVLSWLSHSAPWGNTAQSCPMASTGSAARLFLLPCWGPQSFQRCFVSSPCQCSWTLDCLSLLAGLGRPFCTQPLLLCLLLEILTLGLPGWVRSFPLELKSFQSGQQDTRGGQGCLLGNVLRAVPAALTPSLSSSCSLLIAWLMWSQVHSVNYVHLIQAQLW